MIELNHLVHERETVAPEEQGRSWRPLLDERAGARAWTAGQKIVADLPGPPAIEISDASFAEGKTGLALLCAYLTLAGLDDDENALRFLEQAIQAVASEPMGPSLYGGFTGV